MSNDDRRRLARQGDHAARFYAVLTRLYPRAHRRAFGEQMLQAFRDHYRDRVEADGEPAGRFWLGVVGDESKSLVREHLAALTGRDGPVKRMFAVGLSFTTSAALLFVAVLLVSAATLVSQVAPYPGWQDMMGRNPSLSTFSFAVAVERPTSQFIAAFTQSADAVGTDELRSYHFMPARVEVSTYPLALSATDSSSSLPAVLIDGEPVARLASDLRVVQGRLPAPSSAALEVVVTPTTADQLHLALGSLVPLAASSAQPGQPGQPAPLVRVVGIVQPLTTAFPTDRRESVAPDLVGSDQVRYWAEQNPLDYVLTSTEAIGAYPFDWSQVTSLQTFYDRGGPGAQPLPPSKDPPLWQAWWLAQANFAQMSAQEFTPFFWGHLWGTPDPSPRLNQLLRARAEMQQAGFVAADTTAGFYQGDTFGDYQDSVAGGLIFAWLLIALGEVVLLVCLSRIAGVLVQREEALVAALRRLRVGRGRMFGAFAAQVLVLAGVALAVGGLLALPAARLATAVLWSPSSGQRTVAMQAGLQASNSLVGALIAALTVLIALLVMLRAMGRAAARLPGGGQQEVSV